MAASLCKRITTWRPNRLTSIPARSEAFQGCKYATASAREVGAGRNWFRLIDWCTWLDVMELAHPTQTRRIQAFRSLFVKKPEQEPDESGKYGTDLTALAKSGKLQRVIGLDAEVSRCIDILTRKHNPVLIGDHDHQADGASVAQGIAQRVADGDVPEELRGCRIISVNRAGERIEKVIGKLVLACRRSGEDAMILFIDQVETLAGTTAEGALMRREIRCIGSTSSGEYAKYSKRVPAVYCWFEEVALPVKKNNV